MTATQHFIQYIQGFACCHLCSYSLSVVHRLVQTLIESTLDALGTSNTDAPG